MLIAIDVGNTHTIIGLYEKTELRASWRLQSLTERTVDEYALEILTLLKNAGYEVENIKQVIMSCVVPALARVFSKFCRKYFSLTPLIVGPGTKTGMRIIYDDPRSVGADRIVNAVAAKELRGAPVVVVDFGTATTFDVVNAAGDYEGGVIAPGVLISAQALFERAAMLPNIELTRPSAIVGKNTRDSMLSGIVFGYASLVDGLLERIENDLDRKIPVLATGGLARVIAEESTRIDEVVGDLTLRGLQLIAEKNI